MLVVFDGIDGGGKETQIRLLAAFLKEKGVPFVIHNYPTKKAGEVRAYLARKKMLDDRKLFSLFAEDIKAEQGEIRKELKEKKIVILNRYITSTLAYQGDIVSFKEGKKTTKGFIQPDLIILLDITPSLAVDRKKKQKELDRFESNTPFLERVRKRFLLLKKKHYLTKNWKVIDGGKDTDSVEKEIRKIIIPYLR